jgi:hypothetical protein
MPSSEPSISAAPTIGKKSGVKAVKEVAVSKPDECPEFGEETLAVPDGLVIEAGQELSFVGTLIKIENICTLEAQCGGSVVSVGVTGLPSAGASSSDGGKINGMEDAVVCAAVDSYTIEEVL